MIVMKKIVLLLSLSCLLFLDGVRVYADASIPSGSEDVEQQVENKSKEKKELITDEKQAAALIIGLGLLVVFAGAVAAIFGKEIKETIEEERRKEKASETLQTINHVA